MRCWHCGFENGPGIVACVNCSRALPRPNAGGAVTIEAQRLFTPAIGSSGDSLGTRFHFKAALLSLLPGLGHLLTGRRTRGRILLVSFVVLAPLAVFFAISLLGTIIFAATFTCQVFAVFDAGFGSYRFPSRQASVQAALGVVAFVLFAFYLPIYLLFTSFFSVVVIEDMPYRSAIQRDDVLLLRKLDRDVGALKHGDVVSYLPPDEIRRPIHLPGAQHGYYVHLDDVNVEAILGLAGDLVEFADNRIYVNGVEEPSGRRSSIQLANLSMTVPDGHVMIFPFSMVSNLPSGNPDVLKAVFNTLGRMSMIPYERITGKVVMIYQPLARRKVL